jgi:glyceraldehyde 3-phosphate dehydrogenase
MAMRAGINGFGRIGRSVFRAAYARGAGIEWAGINGGSADVEALAHVLKYDSLLGPFPGVVEVVDGGILVDGEYIPVLAEKDPAALPWQDLGVEVVVEATGRFTGREGASRHLEAGASKVIVSAPADDPDVTLVVGVNDDCYDPQEHAIVSCASCTTNCLAPVASLLHETVGIEHGLITTVHAYTADQRLQDGTHKDFRRGRAAALNLVPTSTGAARALGLVVPELAGRLDGLAIRAPVASGSVVSLVCRVERETTVEEVNEAFRLRADSGASLAGIVRYTEDPIVSSDIVGSPFSAIFDASLTMVLQGRMVKVISWYDNEWGYSNRVVDLTERMLIESLVA